MMCFTRPIYSSFAVCLGHLDVDQINLYRRYLYKKFPSARILVLRCASLQFGKYGRMDVVYRKA